MKRIINGKKYDTETATAIQAYSNDLPHSDFRHYRETLYRKSTGEFFLFGEGGPMTKYADHHAGGFRFPGWGFFPLSERDARDWGERHMPAEAWEAVFGPAPE